MQNVRRLCLSIRCMMMSDEHDRVESSASIELTSKLRIDQHVHQPTTMHHASPASRVTPLIPYPATATAPGKRAEMQNKKTIDHHIYHINPSPCSACVIPPRLRRQYCGIPCSSVRRPIRPGCFLLPRQARATVPTMSNQQHRRQHQQQQQRQGRAVVVVHDG